MTPKQETFVRNYLIDLNSTQAAIRAGYSVRTAEKIGSENLRKPDIAAEIKIAMDERAAREQVNADLALRETASIAFLDPTSLFAPDGSLLPIQKMPPAARAVIAGLEVSEVLDGDGRVVGRVQKVKLVDKLGALTLLARHLGMFTDKIALKGDTVNPLTLLVQQLQGSALRPVPTAALPKPNKGEVGRG